MGKKYLICLSKLTAFAVDTLSSLFTKRQNFRVVQIKSINFSAHKLNVAKMMFSPCNRVENIVRKEENAGHQHFLLFPQCFQKVSSTGSLKVGIVW